MTNASIASSAPRVARPSHVPLDRVRDIDLYALPGLENGFVEAWRGIQQSGLPPMVWTPFNGGHWIGTDGETIRAIYADPQSFSSQVLFIPKAAGEKLDMLPITLDPPEHTPYRKILDSALGLSQIRHAEASVRAIAGELIDGFIERGSCDFATEYAGIFPVRVFMALADLPIKDMPLLRKLADQMTHPDGNTPEEMAVSMEAGNSGFFAYVEPILRARIGNSGTDIISIVANGKIDGKPLPFDKALRLVSLLLLGGLDTVVNFLSFMMLHLARHPEIVAELRNDHLKLMRSSEEMFRRFPITQQGRMVAKDQAFKGVELRAGEMVLLPTVLHSIDESINAEPMKLDPNRKAMSHSTFGGGSHRCAGMHLARTETIVTLEEWFKRIPEFKLRDSVQPVYRAGITANVSNVQLVWNR